MEGETNIGQRYIWEPFCSCSERGRGYKVNQGKGPSQQEGRAHSVSRGRVGKILELLQSCKGKIRALRVMGPYVYGL